jgi:hypothetical protein
LLREEWLERAPLARWSVEAPLAQWSERWQADHHHMRQLLRWLP